MSEIMMAGPMVRRLLDGTKTQTRRTAPRWPKVKPGDVLHVREAFLQAEELDPGCDVEMEYCNVVHFKADASPQDLEWRRSEGQRWTPAVHMPLKLCRMRLVVKRVWQERADEISEADAIAEGMERVPAEDLLEMAGGSKRLVINIFDKTNRKREMSQGYRRELWDYLAQERWPAMMPCERFLMVIDILGASTLDEVTAMEFEVQHVNR